MGSVFLARAVRGPHMGKLVALKRMHPHLERNPQFATGFFDEAWITAGLRHPNIVDTYDWGTDRQGRYIALEFVAGDSVLNLLKAVRSRGEQLPIDVVLYIVGKTAEALHAAHELRNERGELRHLVHRDVTPSNILLSRDGQVKLIDFGVAKARERLQNNTTTNTLKGKFGYMSPEQARGVKTIDRRSDVWSLGVVLWECLAGRRLFKSESELEILRMVTEDTPAAVRSVRPEVPAAVDSLLGAVFAKNRDDRLGSCAEFADYIWAVFREEGYQTDQRSLAEYFRKSLPERCASLDRLVAGEDWHLEPTSAGPGSGSFSGTDAHSGVAPMQPRTPLATGGFSAGNSSQVIYPAPTLAPAVTHTVPAQPAERSKSNIITIAAVGVALVSLGGVAALAAKLRTQQPTPAISQPQPSQSAQPATPPRVEPAANNNPSNVAQPQQQPVNTAAVNTGSQSARVGAHARNTPVERRAATRGNTGNLVLTPTNTTPAAHTQPSNSSNSGESESRGSVGSSTTSTTAAPTTNTRPVAQASNSSSGGSSNGSSNASSNNSQSGGGTMSTIRGW
jgi:serine/threonine-protein kinase